MKRHTLETKITELIGELTQASAFHVIAYELTHDGCGWSVNMPFTILSNGDKAEALEAARGRWENFKTNYASRARVKDIEDISETPLELELEVDCVPFLRIEITEA